MKTLKRVSMVLLLAAAGAAHGQVRAGCPDPDLISGGAPGTIRVMETDPTGHAILAFNAHSSHNERSQTENFRIVVVGPDGGLVHERGFRFSSEDRVTAIATDGAGNITVTGTTLLPAPDAEPLGVAHGAGVWAPRHAFVLKLSAQLRRLKLVVISGNGSDIAKKILAHDHGFYLIGHTSSSDLPITHRWGGSATNTHAGRYDYGFDGFVYALDGDLNMTQGALFGGPGDELVYDAMTDCRGNIAVVGNTNSETFPTTEQAFDRTLNGSTDIFVSLIAPGMDELVASTFLGGPRLDYGRAIAKDEACDIYVGGHTANDHNGIFVEGGYQWWFDGGILDMVLFKLGPSLKEYKAATFLGGHNEEMLTSMQIIGGGVMVAGYTASTDFLASMVDLRHSGGLYDGVFAVLSTDLRSARHLELLGRSGNDVLYDFVVHKDAIWLAGVEKHRRIRSGLLRCISATLEQPGNKLHQHDKMADVER